MIRYAALAALAVAAPASAVTTLSAGVTGTITTSQQTPVPGQQQFTLTGSFTSYFASPDLPQITGNDLGAYSFRVTGTSVAYDNQTRTATYGNVTGTINGYGQVVQVLAPTTLTVAFDPSFGTAAVLGTLLSAGPVTPAGFPGPVDFTPANGAVISGLYVSNGVQGGSFTGNIRFNAVPEPASWAMMIGGFGLAGAALRRRTVRAAYGA